MKRTLFVALAAAALAGNVHAASLTVLGTGGGRIIYDKQDVGTVPLRLTKVPDGTHTVRVVTPAGEKTFTLSYPSAGDHVIDMDRELGVAAAAPRVSREDEERIRRDERRRLESRYRYRYDRYDPYGPYGGAFYGGYPYGYGYNPYGYGYGYPYGGFGGIGFGFGRGYGGFGRRGFRRGGIGFGIGF